MNTITLSFLTTFIAGISTTLGIIPCFMKIKNQKSIISKTLAFSSGIMLTISLVSLIPEAAKILGEIYNPFPAFIITAIFIFIGTNISNLVDNKVEKKLQTDNLYKLGVITSLVLMIHNIPEGITTFISTTANQQLGIKLAFAIALHNIPEGISIAIPIYYATKNKKKAFSYTLIAGFSELFGAILAYIFLKDIITPFVLSITLAITAGIMINISVYEFLPNAFLQQKNKATIYYFVLGIIIIFISELI